MAKRRKLELPNAEDLNKIEEEFRSETLTHRAPGLTPPIAQVAAETAAAVSVIDPAERARQARDSADAETLRTAQEKGLILQELPIHEIAPDDLGRDRAKIDADEMMELRTSIATHGLRLPIEVYELADQSDGKKYGIISGYRRYLATSELATMSRDKERYQTIKAIIKTPQSLSDAVVAMVEENEIRSNLSHFERGRVAALSAQNGIYVNVEEAVNVLFASASKAKRSKIRSFAQVFEELGDLLTEPETLTERQGLRIANALRNGAGGRLRDALAAHHTASGVDDLIVIEPILVQVEQGVVTDGKKTGRPKTNPNVTQDVRELPNGIKLTQTRQGTGFAIHMSGRNMDEQLANDVMNAVERLLERAVN